MVCRVGHDDNSEFGSLIVEVMGRELWILLLSEVFVVNVAGPESKLMFWFPSLSYESSSRFMR